MKNILFGIIMLIAQLIHAQKTEEGTIEYTQTIYPYEHLTKDQMIYKSLIPDKIESAYKISFKNNSYRVENFPLKTDKKDKPGGVIVNVVNSNSHDFLVNNEKNTKYTFYKSEGKSYLTEETFDKTKVSVNKEVSKKILGYTCYKAIYKNDNETFELWITSIINMDCNPIDAEISGGTILEIKGKGLHIVAKKIDLKPIDEKKISIDKNITKISKEQAEDITEENMEALKQKTN